MGKKDTQKQPKGRFICAWCGKDLGPSGTDEDSHGVCKECAKKFLGVEMNEDITPDDKG